MTGIVGDGEGSEVRKVGETEGANDGCAVGFNVCSSDDDEEDDEDDDDDELLMIIIRPLPFGLLLFLCEERFMFLSDGVVENEKCNVM